MEIFSQVVKTATAPLYARPGLGEPWVDEALHGMKVLPVKEKEDWAYVCTEYGYPGWVRRDCLQENHAMGSPEWYINVSAADVLVEPKVQAPALLCLPRGARCRAESADGGYSLITLADGRRGYVRSAFLAAWAPDTPVTRRRRRLRKAICDTALSYLYTQYRWGGKTPQGIDCSGLAFMAYWLNGITIYRDARIEPGFPIQAISPQRARRGDLLFFPGHVGIVLGGGAMIHASEAGNGVCIEALTPKWRTRITAAGSVFSSF